jgi:hypothetical protein
MRAAATLPRRSSVIVLVLAHLLAPAFNVTGATEPPLIYDYAGFLPHTHTLDYRASGQPALAQRIAVLLQQTQLPAQVDPVRGFDHGVFISLKLVFPDTDIRPRYRRSGLVEAVCFAHPIPYRFPPAYCAAVPGATGVATTPLITSGAS